MKTYLSSVSVLLAFTWWCAASDGPGNIWGPVTNNVTMSILVRNDSPTFTGDEINDPAAVIARIKKHGDKVSTFLWEQSSKREQSAFLDFRPSAPDAEQVEDNLADVLNRTIAGPGIFSIDRFRGSRLTGETRLLLEKDPIGTNLVALNRLLLENIYPFELARRAKPDGTRVRKGELVVLTVSLKNLSTNETHHFFSALSLEHSMMVTIEIVAPSGILVPPPRLMNTFGHAMDYRLSPGDCLHLTFHLEYLYDFQEIGQYRITCGFVMQAPEQSPPTFMVFANPLTIRVVP